VCCFVYVLFVFVFDFVARVYCVFEAIYSMFLFCFIFFCSSYGVQMHEPQQQREARFGGAVAR
jgi:hypothetical protein